MVIHEFSLIHFQSLHIHEAYCASKWYNFHSSYGKSLTICMVGTSRPLVLTAGGLYTFSKIGYTAVSRKPAPEKEYFLNLMFRWCLTTSWVSIFLWTPDFIGVHYTHEIFLKLFFNKLKSYMRYIDWILKFNFSTLDTEIGSDLSINVTYSWRAVNVSGI